MSELDDIVDCVAEIAVDLAGCFGHTDLIFNNEDGSGAVTLSGYIDTGYGGESTLYGGNTDSQDINIIIPKQTGFPPSQINTGSTVTANSVKYSVISYEADVEDLNLTASVTLTCSKLNQDFLIG